jgi:lysophospholipase L1-like esterase
MMRLYFGLGIEPGANPRAGRNGLLPSPHGVVFDGDSLTAGTPLNTAPYPSQFTANTGQPVNNTGVSGDGLANRHTKYAAEVAPLYDASTKDTLVILAGTADIRGGQGGAFVENEIHAYCALARATGFRVVVATLIPDGETDWTATMEAYRTEYNTWLRSNHASFADGLIDFASIPALDPDNPAYYQADKLHPTNRASRLMAELTRQRFGLANVDDATPGAFSFTDVTDATVSTVSTSNAVEVGGFTAPAAISIAGGEYSINGAAWTAAGGLVNPYDLVQVRVTSSASAGTATSVTLTVGGVSGTYAVTTAPAGVAFNPTPVNGSWTFSNGNKTATQTNAGTATVITDTAITGRKLFAVTSDIRNGDFICIGVHDGAATSQAVGLDGHGYGFWSNNSFIPGFDGGPNWPADGQNIALAIDATAKKIWVTVDGANWYGSGGTARSTADVAAGTGGYGIGSLDPVYGAVGADQTGGKKLTKLAAWPWASPPNGYSIL